MMHKILMEGEKRYFYIPVELKRVQLKMGLFFAYLKISSGAVMTQEVRKPFFSSVYIFMSIMLYFIMYLISDSTTVNGCGFG